MVMSSPTKSKSQSRLREKNVVTQQGPFHPVPETCGKKLSAVDAFSAICHCLFTKSGTKLQRLRGWHDAA